MTVLEFVSRYVDLKPTASGAVGLFPFHNDRHPSFWGERSGELLALLCRVWWEVDDRLLDEVAGV